MEPLNWYFAVLKKYVQFQGRASRPEYWWFTLCNVVAALILAMLDKGLGTGALLGTIYGLAVFLPSLGVAVRRLHDTGRTGWWLLIGLIPILGTIVLIIFFVQRSQEGPNRFGPPAPTTPDA